MRLARRTFAGAFHHGMNRGFEGRPILQEPADKELFLELMGRTQALLQVRILAYCLMDNHYHVVLENSSGRMGDFFRQLNGRFASQYRKRHGGVGYVFQGRYKSMLIQDDAYLLVAISYVLRNPVRAKICESFLEYPWSSAGLYFQAQESTLVDGGFVEGLFGGKDEMSRIVMELDCQELPMVHSAIGMVIGGEEFISRATELAERRSGSESMERRRCRDKHFEPIEKVYMEFENIHRIGLAELDFRTYAGKRLRGELLLELRERAGLTYREIAKLDWFADLEYKSLGKLYKQALSRRHGTCRAF